MPTLANKPEIRQAQGRFRPEWLPNPRAFAEKELGRLSKPYRGWVKANCCFHASKSKTSFSLNLQTGGWICWGCDLRGDMVKFVRLRYHLDFIGAAKYLQAWDGDVTREHIATIDAARLELHREQEAKAAKIAEARGRRIQARGWLHALEAHYRSESARLSELHGAESAAAETAWENLAMLHVEIAEADAEYCELSGLEFSQ